MIRAARLRAVSRAALRRAPKALAWAAAVYVAAGAGLFLVMRQPPLVAGKALSFVPWPLLAALPSEWLWCEARAGELAPGDPAPDFELPTLDRSGTVRLSAFRGDRPVVLVFGSYT